MAHDASKWREMTLKSETKQPLKTNLRPNLGTERSKLALLDKTGRRERNAGGALSLSLFCGNFSVIFAAVCAARFQGIVQQGLPGGGAAKGNRS